MEDFRSRGLKLKLHCKSPVSHKVARTLPEVLGSVVPVGAKIRVLQRSSADAGAVGLYALLHLGTGDILFRISPTPTTLTVLPHPVEDHAIQLYAESFYAT